MRSKAVRWHTILNVYIPNNRSEDTQNQNCYLLLVEGVQILGILNRYLDEMHKQNNEKKKKEADLFTGV